MCGIAGIISTNPDQVRVDLLEKMAHALRHRGPDGDGIWKNMSGKVGFAHRRLAIIDLTDAAVQPMHYLQRYTIVYNGEIYNYREIRKDLMKQGYHFHSTGDTEVILAAYDCYKEKCLDYFDGMFSFALWDEDEQSLFAARDRFGEKPFFYHWEKGLLLFASEMKALWKTGVSREVDQKMLMNYLSLGYVQNPAEKSQTFYTKVQSLPPSHFMRIDLRTLNFQIQQYWNIDKQFSIDVSEEEAIRELDNLLEVSVHRRLRSDVPVGVSLSGGLDSSAICSYISRNQSLPNKAMKSFSASFPGFEKDETSCIDIVAKEFLLNSYKVTPTAGGLVNDFEKMFYHQEEPFLSSSLYAQYKVFELAKANGVTVVLDGQGADEILAGYHKYLHWYLQEVFSRNRFFKVKKERALFMKHKIKVNWGLPNILASYLPSHAAIALEKREYQRILHNHDLSKDLLANLKGREWEGIHKPIITKLNDILYFNTMSNGLEELLRFSDRNAMAHGIEVRLPFLNARLVKYIFSLPSDMKIANGFPKWILRKLMEKRLPPEIVWRTDKVGFEPPQKSWMSEPVLIDYLHEAKKKLVNEHILKPSVLNRKPKPMPAYSRDNFDWRYLCASRLIS